MSNVQCACFTDFPPRDFQRVRHADEFSTRVRFSTYFMQLDNEGLRFGCRRCGQAWGFRMEGPPFQWRPEGRADEPETGGQSHIGIGRHGRKH